MVDEFIQTKSFVHSHSTSLAEANARDHSVILNVRTKSGPQTGHISRAKHLVVLSSDLYQSAQSLDSSKHFQMNSGSGKRSGEAWRQLSNPDFEQLRNLCVGILKLNSKLGS